MARDFLTIATNGVGVERLFNSSRDVCHYRRSRLHADTIEAIMLQMCTDRFAIKEEYQNILEELNVEDVLFTLNDNDDTEDGCSVVYISDVEDVDDMDDSLEEDGSDHGDSVRDHDLPLPSDAGLARSQRSLGASHEAQSRRHDRSLRHHDRRPGQYKE